MPAIRHLPEPLRDDGVVVRDGAERDIPEILIAYQDDPDLHLRLGQARPPSGAQLGHRAETEPADREAGLAATLTILEPGSDVCVGQVNLHHFDWEHGRAELGIWLAPQVRGRGMGHRALRLASAWVLRSHDIDRVQVTTEPDNQAMIKTAKAAGFQYEGILRGYTRERGRRVDVAMFSLLASDLDS